MSDMTVHGAMCSAEYCEARLSILGGESCGDLLVRDGNLSYGDGLDLRRGRTMTGGNINCVREEGTQPASFNKMVLLVCSV